MSNKLQRNVLLTYTNYANAVITDLNRDDDTFFSHGVTNNGDLWGDTQEIGLAELEKDILSKKHEWAIKSKVFVL